MITQFKNLPSTNGIPYFVGKYENDGVPSNATAPENGAPPEYAPGGGKYWCVAGLLYDGAFDGGP